MLIFAGLGNPGPKYARHRHNVGYMVADEIIRRYGFRLAQARHHSYVATGDIGGEKILLLKPKTFMNHSGRAVGSALRYYKLKARDVTAFYDELDLVPGKVRVKRGGGAGGHNGIRSLDSNIGKDYRRIRIGIGHPGDRNQVQHYVLSDIAKADQPLIRDVVDAVCEALPILVEGDDAGFMTKVALLCPPPKSATATEAG
jgi:PTH1 family peptidyl-tRNA hydrolase